MAEEKEKSPVSQLLQDAQGLLQGGRSDHYEATDDNDEPIDPTHKDAKKFSVWGALKRAAFDRRDSTGLDTALLYLGAGNSDPELRGFNRLEDDPLGKRFEEAIRLADGGERREQLPGVVRRKKEEDKDEKKSKRKHRSDDSERVKEG